jgi:hypothetical protein
MEDKNIYTKNFENKNIKENENIFDREKDKEKTDNIIAENKAVEEEMNNNWKRNKAGHFENMQVYNDKETIQRANKI